MFSFETDILQCLAALQNEGTILYPTDTIWGIGCDATNFDAVEKIIHLKNRPSEKSFAILVADDVQLMKYVASVDDKLLKYLETIQKPTTVIYERAIGFADNVIADNGTVAIRICRDEFCKHLIKRFGKPIVSTSANISGMPSAPTFGEISPAIIDGVDYVVKYRQTDKNPAQASTIIQWKNGEINVIRY
jgi:L-threonylcarbamoyladenylate synthase